MTSFLAENVVLSAPEGRLLRLLWLPPGAEDVALIDVLDKMAMPYWLSSAALEHEIAEGKITPLTEDPMMVRADSSLSEAEKAIRKSRMDAIRPLIEDPARSVLYVRKRGRLVVERAAELGIDHKSVYRYLRLWWRLGQLPNALAGDYTAVGLAGKTKAVGTAKKGRPKSNGSGDVPPGINVDAEILARMLRGRAFLATGSQVQAWKNTKLAYFSDPQTVDGQRRNVIWPDARLPSFAQFVYHVVRNERRGDIIRGKIGDSAYERKHRARLGTARDKATGPGSLYQVDSTIADVYLRSRINKDRLIGRPVLYIVVDAYSRMIVGFHVAMSGPSWETAMCALENAMTDKVESCAAFGITIRREEWPASHVPRKLVGDRGPEMVGGSNSAAGFGLGYEVKALQPFRPDWKGLVESRFNLLTNEEIRFVPGALHSENRGEGKHMREAIYTMDSFVKLIVRGIINYNRSFEVNKPPTDYVRTDGHPPSPLELWNYGCKNNGAPQFADKNRVRQNLLSSGKARETDRGLRFRGLHFVPPEELGIDWFERTGAKRRERPIRYDPRSTSHIFLVKDKGKGFIPFRLGPVDREYDGLTFDEADDMRAMLREGRNLAADRRHAFQSQHEADLADIDREAHAEVDGIPLFKQKGMEIKEERAKEAKENRIADRWVAPPAPPEPPPAMPEPEPPRAVTPVQQPGAAPRPPAVPVPTAPDYMSVLAEMRKRGRKRPQ